MQTNENLVISTPAPTREQILSVLGKYGLPSRDWGRGNNRSLEDFLGYMQSDQFAFSQNSNGSDLVHIELNVAVVIVLYHRRGEWLELYEDRQTFPDGEVLCRTNVNGIAETIHRNETPQSGAIRCLGEELQFRNPDLFVLSDLLQTEHRPPCPSEKWPGVMATYHRYVFECVVYQRLFRPGGYVEYKKNGRQIYFKWRPRQQLEFSVF